MRVLTVGDGDLTFALALKRAYPDAVEVTATTLIANEDELIQTYSNAASVVQELTQVWNQTIHYAIDATQLHTYLQLQQQQPAPAFDVIMFNHPHLGDASLQTISEQHHAQRHYILLCHYFHSAKELLLQQSNYSGRVHVCLCGTQPDTWKVQEAAQMHGWECAMEQGTSSPMDAWLFPNNTTTTAVAVTAEVQSHYPCPRKYRNGKLGSKHWLGKYGYRHRRTGGDHYGGTQSDMMVHQSINFTFTLPPTNNNTIATPTCSTTTTTCPICKIVFSNPEELQQHLKSPAMPDIMTGQFLHSKQKPTIEQPSSSSTPITSSSTLELANSSFSSKLLLKDVLSNTSCKVLMETTILPLEYHGKRIKWLCRQNDFPFSIYMKSKKQCKDIIQSGRIFINGSVVMDDARMVQQNDVLTILNHSTITPPNSNSTTIQPPQSIRTPPSSSNTANPFTANITTSISQQDQTHSYHSQNSHYGVKILQTIPLSFSVSNDNHTNNKNDENVPTVNLIIAEKPVSIRTVGTFASNTMEMIVPSMVRNSLSAAVSHEEKDSYSCVALSKLETGCGGLCVLAMADNNAYWSRKTIQDHLSSSLQIIYTFTVLVHGIVPSQWKQEGTYIQIPTSSAPRKWKRKKPTQPHNDSTIDTNENTITHDNYNDTKQNLDIPENTDDVNVQSPTSSSSPILLSPSSVDGKEKDIIQSSYLFVKCIDATNFQPTNDKDDASNITSLSTLEIKSTHDEGRLANVISFILRKLGYPVVNDRFCKREYASLPRIMRNTLKQKICICCNGIDITPSSTQTNHTTTITPLLQNFVNQRICIPPNRRTQCSYWREILKLQGNDLE